MDLDALKTALAASPDNVPLIVLVAKGSMEAFELEEAATLYQRALEFEPDHAEALLGQIQLLDLEGRTSEAVLRATALCAKQASFGPGWLARARLALKEDDANDARAFYDKAMTCDPNLAEDDLLERIIRAGGTGQKRVAVASDGSVIEQEWEDASPFEGLDAVLAHELELEYCMKSDVKFADVGGMEVVKDDIRMKIIHPLKNPKLFEAYGKKAGGGVLMYGPPGCGKTLLARATAGEIDATFFSVGLHQVLNMYIGESENKLHAIFGLARKAAPSVLFFDEIDALAADRRDMRQSAGRGIINQFLAELDGAEDQNDGVLVLGATNAPWHLDGAFLRPGRFDRMLFVPPPDTLAREEIAAIQIRDKPIVGFAPKELAKRTEGFSGADMKAVFDLATEAALTEAMKKGSVVPVNEKMVAKAAKSVRPSTKKWFESAKNYALYANQSGFYDDVLAYLGIRS